MNNLPNPDIFPSPSDRKILVADGFGLQSVRQQLPSSILCPLMKGSLVSYFDESNNTLRSGMLFDIPPNWRIKGVATPQSFPGNASSYHCFVSPESSGKELIEQTIFVGNTPLFSVFYGLDYPCITISAINLILNVCTIDEVLNDPISVIPKILRYLQKRGRLNCPGLGEGDRNGNQILDGAKSWITI